MKLADRRIKDVAACVTEANAVQREFKGARKAHDGGDILQPRSLEDTSL